MATIPLTSRMIDTGSGSDELIQAGPNYGIGRNGLNQSGYQWTNTCTQNGQSFLQRSGGKIIYSGSGTNGNSNISTVFQADQEAQVEFTTMPGSGNSIFLFLRIQNPGATAGGPGLNCYFFGFTDGASGAQTYTVGGLVDNSFITTIGSGTIASGDTIVAGDAFLGQVIGTTLAFGLRKSGVWTQIGGDFTNSQVTGTGQIGLETQGALSAVQMVNFKGGGSFEDSATRIALLRNV